MSDNNYLIYTDSAADLPEHIFEEYDLRIVHMDYNIDGEEISYDTGRPDHNKFSDAFYEALKNGSDIKTTQVTPFNYVEAFSPELEAGHDILYLCFSSGMSGTYANACMAAEELKDEYPNNKLVVIDTLAATMGQGVFARAALINRENGMSLEENAAWLIEKRPYISHRFLVGDLHHLHKGGRVSAAVAIVGSMLKIKPIIIIDDEGKLQVVSKVRGMKPALKKIFDGYMKTQGVPDVPKIIHVGHTSLYDIANSIKEQLEEVVDKDTIVETVNMGPIVGTHVGPELISICGWTFNRDEL